MLRGPTLAICATLRRRVRGFRRLQEPALQRLRRPNFLVDISAESDLEFWMDYLWGPSRCGKTIRVDGDAGPNGPFLCVDRQWNEEAAEVSDQSLFFCSRLISSNGCGMLCECSYDDLFLRLL